MEEARLARCRVKQRRLHQVPLQEEPAELLLGLVPIARMRVSRTLLVAFLAADILDMTATHVHSLYGAVVGHPAHHLDKARALRDFTLQILAVYIAYGLLRRFFNVVSCHAMSCFFSGYQCARRYTPRYRQAVLSSCPTPALLRR